MYAHLKNLGVTGCSVHTTKFHGPKVHLAHVWRRRVPVHIDRCAKVECGGEDARFRDLPLGKG